MPCNTQHTVLLDRRGQIYGFGDNSRGQLGIKSELTQNNPTSDFAQYFAKFNQNFSILPSPTLIKVPVQFRSVTAGKYHTIGIDEDGFGWGWGSNCYGALGLGNEKGIFPPSKLSLSERLSSIHAGPHFTAAIDSSGLLWVFGKNSSGQLGLNHFRMCITPTLNPYFTDVKAFIAGAKHSFVIDSSNVVWAFGCNDGGKSWISG
jgi:alpha-tubulin suppressor-like RCC1 family protein